MEIKKIKEFITEKNTVQFEVLARFRPGAYVDIVLLTPGPDGFKESEFQTKSEQGVIKVVRRILDDKTLFLGDCENIIYDSESESSGFTVIEFSEDLIHCIVFDSKDKEMKLIEINNFNISTIAEFMLEDRNLSESEMSKIRKTSNYEEPEYIEDDEIE